MFVKYAGNQVQLYIPSQEPVKRLNFCPAGHVADTGARIDERK